MADILGDFRTLYPYAKHFVFGTPACRPSEWSTELEDPDVGTVRLTGQLREHPAARELWVILHGLGGGADSYYCLQGAAAVERFGGSSLCLSLRGSDRRGEDFYNIAQTVDLHAALASPTLARYERIYLLGYSMGGYVAMHYACEPRDERVRGVAAICTPLDLRTAQKHVDSRRGFLYRRHVLGGLKSIYAAVAERRDVPTDPARVSRVRTIYEWDEVAIVPRYGFESPESYYGVLGIERRLDDMRVPSLLVAAENDPVTPLAAIRPIAEKSGANPNFQVAYVPGGGHLVFPRDLDLGYGPRLGLEPQVFQWQQSLD